MSSPEIRGWCPGAHRPMASGDGLVVRVRPPAGALTAAQAKGLAALAERYGNGLIDLTNRANLQLRGVTEAGHGALLDGLVGLGLIDTDPQIDARLNIVLDPFRGTDDRQTRLAEALAHSLAAAIDLALPSKFGFVIDAGDNRQLAEISGDIRIEAAGDDLLLRADGRPTGRPVPDITTAVALALDMARWFVASGGMGADGRGRMRRHLAAGAVLPEALSGDHRPADARPAPGPRAYAPRALPGSGLRTAHTRRSDPPGRKRCDLPPDHTLADGVPAGRHGPARHRAPDRARRSALAGRCLHRRAGMPAIQRRDPQAGAKPRPASAPGRPAACVGLRQGLRPPEPGKHHACRQKRALRSCQGRRAVGRRRPARPCARCVDGNHRQLRPMPYSYETDGAAIYAESFATIRAEADLARFSPEEEPIAVRMIHAAGLVGLEAQMRFSPGMAVAARRALEAGAPILCDAHMVSEGVTRKRLPADNPVICTLRAPKVGPIWRRSWAQPGPPPRLSSGGRIWPAASWPSATRPRRCFICWRCSRTRTAPARRRSSAARWALSAPPNPRTRCGRRSRCRT